MGFIGNFTEWRRKEGETDPEKMWEFVRDFTRSADYYIKNEWDAMVEFRDYAEWQSNENRKIDFNYIG